MKKSAMAALICGCMVVAGGVLGGVGFLLGGSRSFYVDSTGAHYYQDASAATLTQEAVTIYSKQGTLHHTEDHQQETTHHAGECQTEYWEHSDDWEDWDTLVALDVLDALDRGNGETAAVQEGSRVQGERREGDIQLIPFHKIRGSFAAEEVELVEADRFAVEYDLDSIYEFRLLEVENDTLTIELAPSANQQTYLNFSLNRWPGYVRIYYPAGTHFEEINIEYTSGSLTAQNLSARHLSVTYASGTCNLKGVSGTVEVSAAGGSVKVTDSELEAVDIACGTGAVRLENLTVRDAVCIATASGDTELVNLRANGLDLSGASGKFRLDTCTANNLSAELISGSISGTALETQDLYAFSTSGRIDLSGAFYNQCVLRSTSGSIRFHTLLPESAYTCSVKTVSGSVRGVQTTGTPDAPNRLEISITSGSAECSFGE